MKKSTVIAVLVFGALLVGAFLSMSEKPERGITRIDFSTVDIATVDKIEISGAKPIEIKKAGEAWILGNGKEADSNAVQRLLEKIPEINSSDLVTQDATRFAELEVDEEKGSRVKVFAGAAALADFVVGKGGSGGAHLRMGDNVYLVNGVFPGIFAKQASAWHQLKLFKDKLEDVTRVEVTNAGKPSYALVKQEEAWALEDPSGLPEGFRFDANAARNIVSTLVNLRAREILDADPGAEQTGLGEGADSLVFVAKEGARAELQIGKSGEDKQVFAQVVGKADIYKLPEYTAKNLRKQVTDLRDMKLVALDKTTVNRLIIKSEARQLSFEKQGSEWKIDKSSDPVPDDFALDSMAVHRKVQAMDSARGMHLAAPDVTLAKAGLTKPKTTITATQQDGSSFTLAFGGEFKDEERDVLYAKGTVDDAIYVVSKWTRDNFTQALDKYAKRDAPAGMPNIDPQQLANLPPDVRENLMKQLQQKQREQQMMQQLQAQMQAKQKAEADKPAK